MAIDIVVLNKKSMKNIWKNVLGVALIAAISSGAAIGTIIVIV